MRASARRSATVIITAVIVAIAVWGLARTIGDAPSAKDRPPARWGHSTWLLLSW
jgi:hypothetical protein